MFNYLKLIIFTFTVFFTVGVKAQSNPQPDECSNTTSGINQHTFSCYRKAQQAIPLTYTSTGTKTVTGLQKRSYELVSQTWSPEQLVAPEKWTHEVNIYIPDDALLGRALLMINNGTNHATEAQTVAAPTDFSDEKAATIAQRTRTIVVTVSNVPNQFLTYRHDGVARKEDDSVAHSWKLFSDAPARRSFLSLHVPMVGTAVKAMDLAEKELRTWNIHRFIVSGASKRGWTAWHAAIADSRVEAIVPFVIDILDMRNVLERTYQTYGRNWPIAFQAYYREGITEQRHDPTFQKLMEIEDPLRYVDGPYADRLTIPKYIVNASGDDFFIPDNAQLYFDKLQGEKALRVTPNTNHTGIRSYIEHALISFTNRLQQSVRLPSVTTELTTNPKAVVMSVHFSEPPVQVTRWTAVNPVARDFRYACGIIYTPTTLQLTQPQNITVSLPKPATGWAASFIEAHFADGFVATTPVSVYPDSVYPTSAPPASDPACHTLPGRDARPSE